MSTKSRHLKVLTPSLSWGADGSVLPPVYKHKKIEKKKLVAQVISLPVSSKPIVHLNPTHSPLSRRATDGPFRDKYRKLSPNEITLDFSKTDVRKIELKSEWIKTGDDNSQTKDETCVDVSDDDDDVSVDEDDVVCLEEDDFTPPDGGYGWFIVLGCFLQHVIIGGLDRCESIFLIQFIDRFNATNQVAAWPGALLTAIRLLMGPAAAAMSNRYSVRTSVLVGSLLFVTGMLLDGYVTNIYLLFITHALIQGIGRGLIYAPGISLVGMYFEKRRGLAVGVSTSGMGVGTFGLARLTEYLFDEYHYSATFLILSGVACNCFVIGMLYRPLSLHRKLTETKNKNKNNTNSSDIFTTFSSIVNFLPFSVGIQSSPFYIIKDVYAQNKNKSSYLPNIFSKTEEKQKSPTLKEIISTKPDTKTESGKTEKDKTIPSDFDANNKSQTKQKIPILTSLRKIIFPIEKFSDSSNQKRKLFQPYLLKDPSFLCYCLSMVLFNMGSKSAIMFMKVLAEKVGLSEETGGNLIQIGGLVDTGCRILLGFVFDFKIIKPMRTILYNSILFLTAAVSFLIPTFTEEVPIYILSALFFGLTGAYVSQKSVVLVDILGRANQANAFGLLICFQGLGSAIGPPLFGYLTDTYGSMTPSFYMGGSFMVVAGLMMVISNVLLHRRQRMQHNQEEQGQPKPQQEKEQQPELQHEEKTQENIQQKQEHQEEYGHNQ